jgi:hypothetical protein
MVEWGPSIDILSITHFVTVSPGSILGVVSQPNEIIIIPIAKKVNIVISTDVLLLILVTFF